jgi:hypothetical protein
MTHSKQASDSLHDELVDSKTLEAAGMIGVFDENGSERPFGGLVRHGKVCVIFIRYFLSLPSCRSTRWLVDDANNQVLLFYNFLLKKLMNSLRRHFLCGYCQDYLAALKGLVRQQPIGDKKIIVIGCGHWSVIKSYKGTYHVTCLFQKTSR